MGGFDRLSELTLRHLAAGDFAGAVVRVERRGTLLFESAWGDAFSAANPAERRPMGNGTLFDLASVSKLFTTAAILSLASSGGLDLDGAAADWLDSDSPAREALSGATIRSLLTHASGLHYWFPFYTHANESFDSILAAVCAKNPRKPGTVIYSDLNFMLLGMIVERATGLPLRAAVRDLVFRPLALGRTGYGPLDPEACACGIAAAGGIAATEWGNRIERGMVKALGLSFSGWRDESRPLVGEADDGNCHYRFGGAAGHAGVFSDARDLCALGTAFIGGIAVSPGPPAGADPFRDHGGGRGLGFQTGALFPGGGWGHTGFTGTLLHVNPESGLVFVLLANRLHVPSPHDIGAWRLAMSEAILEGVRKGAAESAPLD